MVLVGLNIFSLVLFFICVMESSNMLGFWFSLELLTLSVLPHFFSAP